jgi:sugar phosphate isomerase/epimerase
MTEYPIGAFLIIDDHLDARLDATVRLGLTSAQILAPARDKRTSHHISGLAKKFDQAHIEISVVFCGFDGESYADIPTVIDTVGLVPESTRSARLQEAKEISDFARSLGVPVTALHLGFIPPSGQPDHRKIVEITQELCDYCGSNGQALHLETGQETAEELLVFIKEVDRINLAVNFDPANMILYGCGEPIPAVRILGKYIKSVHCKDATWAQKPGKEWGREVPLGEGDVDIERFLSTLKDIGYVGPLTIEREISGQQQLVDFEKGVRLLTRLSRKIWAGDE